jgi:hypothetical protein
MTDTTIDLFSPAAAGRLRAELDGELVVAGDGGYESLRQIWNGCMIVGRRRTRGAAARATSAPPCGRPDSARP